MDNISGGIIVMASPNTRKSSDVEDNELYITPQDALWSFYKAYPEAIDQYDVYYDPCTGLGDIADFLEGLGKKVYRADKNYYGDDRVIIQDFLELESLPDDVQCIIHNPPFTLTEKFIDKSLELCHNLLMFNRMVTIESKGRANKFYSGEWPLDTMYQFGFRVSCAKGINRKKTANSVAYSWFEFSQAKYMYGGVTDLRWITEKYNEE